MSDDLKQPSQLRETHTWATNSVPAATQSDQPERSAIDEANSILYPNRTSSSGADARGLDRNTPEFIIRTVSRLACNDGCQHFDECEQEKIEPYLRIALPALLESFRAETLEQAAQLAYDYVGTREDTEPSELRDMILALSPDRAVQPSPAKEWRLESPLDHGKFKQMFMDALPSPASADAREIAEKIFNLFQEEELCPCLSCRAEDGPTLAALLESFRNKPAVISADARELAAPHSPLWEIVHEYVGSDSIGDCWAEVAPLLESFRAATLEQAAQLVSDTPRTPALTGAMDSLTDKIRNLGSDPNWLARQIAQAKWDEAKWWAHADRPNGPRTLYPDEKEHLNALDSERAKLESGK